MIYIIGAGLFGMVARDLLNARGIDCATIDDGRPLAGSYPAGCLTKPSWLTSVPNAKEALALLDELYGLQSIPMRVLPVRARLDTINHVPPSAILRGPDIRGRVARVDPDGGRIILEDGREFTGAILVAAGVWSKDLLPDHFRGVPLTGLQGCSHRFAGELPEARLKVWAPFKQSVAFNIEEGVVWFGDGTATKPETFSDDHVKRSLEHATDLGLYPSGLKETRTGLRPYVRGHAGWFRRVSKTTWVSTGGAKNGVVLAAAQALEFLRDL